MRPPPRARTIGMITGRSEEHTSELQSQSHPVCRLLLEKIKHLPPAAGLLLSGLRLMARRHALGDVVAHNRRVASYSANQRGYGTRRVRRQKQWSGALRV